MTGDIAIPSMQLGSWPIVQVADDAGILQGPAKTRGKERRSSFAGKHGLVLAMYCSTYLEGRIIKGFDTRESANKQLAVGHIIFLRPSSRETTTFLVLFVSLLFSSAQYIDPRTGLLLAEG